ncbi:MAG: hypothetical protein AAGA58_13670 [Verrucomicrobiota bacterium]
MTFFTVFFVSLFTFGGQFMVKAIAKEGATVRILETLGYWSEEIIGKNPQISELQLREAIYQRALIERVPLAGLSRDLVFLDSFGKPIRFEKESEDQPYAWRSSGRDGVFDTGDDVWEDFQPLPPVSPLESSEIR